MATERVRQLNLGWKRQERKVRDSENVRRKREQLMKFIQTWKEVHPDKPAFPRIIAESFGISRTTARRRVRDLLKIEPGLVKYVRPERKLTHSPSKRGPNGWTLEGLSSHSTAYRNPDIFVSLGRVLRDLGIHKTPGAAADVLSENRIGYVVFESTRQGVEFNRYIVSVADRGRIIDALNSAFR